MHTSVYHTRWQKSAKQPTFNPFSLTANLLMRVKETNERTNLAAHFFLTHLYIHCLTNLGIAKIFSIESFSCIEDFH